MKNVLFELWKIYHFTSLQDTVRVKKWVLKHLTWQCRFQSCSLLILAAGTEPGAQHSSTHEWLPRKQGCEVVMLRARTQAFLNWLIWNCQPHFSMNRFFKIIYTWNLWKMCIKEELEKLTLKYFEWKVWLLKLGL